MSPKPTVVLSLTQLQRGYGLSIDNAMRCLGASSQLLEEYPDKALGLGRDYESLLSAGRSHELIPDVEKIGILGPLT